MVMFFNNLAARVHLPMHSLPLHGLPISFQARLMWKKILRHSLTLSRTPIFLIKRLKKKKGLLDRKLRCMMTTLIGACILGLLAIYTKIILLKLTLPEQLNRFPILRKNYFTNAI